MLDSKTAEGPARWVRAKENAERNPNSAGAKLYRSRDLNAAAVADMIHADCADRTVTFVAVQAVRTPSVGRTKATRRYSTCSAYCAAMQLQLWLSTSEHIKAQEWYTRPEPTVERMLQWLSAPGKEVVVYTDRYESSLVLCFDDVKGQSRCQCCGKTLLPPGATDKATVKAIAAAEKPDTTKYVVTSDGRLLTLDKLRVVELTDRDYELLCVYSTPELRLQYGAAHGFPLSEA